MNNFAQFMKEWLEEAEKELPFVEETATKEQCFDMVRGMSELLKKSGCGPYTVFKFQQECNNIARHGGNYTQYYGVCARYYEYNILRQQKNSQLTFREKCKKIVADYGDAY